MSADFPQRGRSRRGLSQQPGQSRPRLGPSSAIPNRLVLVLVLLIELLVAAPAVSMPLKILVVMSYQQDNPWSQEIKEGIDGVLAEHADLSYFYMNTEVDVSGGPAKARQAFALFEGLQPDGVIAADDNAQSMFVVPYLKERFDTPVFFCGVNADADRYGYPNNHISGILERGHIRESIAFARQLVEELDDVCFLAKASPSGEALRDQVEAEKSSYLSEVKRFDLVTSIRELQRAAVVASRECDAIYIDSFEGIVGQSGEPLAHREVFSALSTVYHGTVIGAKRYHVHFGALSAVIKSGQEQGETAASMLMQALRGTAVNQLAVRRNYRGHRLINVSTLKSKGIRPRPIVLRGATLVGNRPSPD